MSNIVEAEYQVVQERTLPVIISEIKIIEQNTARIVLENGIQIGQHLQEAKEQVGHGNFGQWCEENLNYDQRTANRFMKLAVEYGDENGLLANSTTLSNLSISNALSLLKVPEEDREQFVAEHDVEDMKNKELEEEIRKLKEEKSTLEEEVEQVAKDRTEVNGKLADAVAEVESLKAKLAVATNELEPDQEEIEKLKADLKKEAARADKLTKQLKEEKEGRKEEVFRAVEKEKEEIRKTAMKEAGAAMNDAVSERDGLKEENAALKRKLANAGAESIVKFKILVDQLQDVYDQAGQCILVEPDQEKAGKMKSALRQVVQKFLSDL